MEARKFDTDYRKRLVAKLSAIHDKPSLVELYRIILNDVGDDFSSNSNGIFYDVNRFSDCCIQSLADYVGENKRKALGPIVYKPYTAESELTGFSNSNKVILGKMRRES